MKKLCSFLLIISLFTLYNCSSDSPTDPGNNPTDIIIVTERIGPAGGTIATDNISLAIPSNSLSVSAQIEIFSITDSPLENEKVSGSYKIEGIPGDYSKPIKVVLSKDKNVSGSPYIAVGSETFSKSLNTTSTAYCMFPARDSAGYLVADIPVREVSLAKTSGRNIFSNITLQVEAVGLFQTTSTSSHFKILHGNVYTSQAAALAGFLEEAYTDYTNMGFVFNITEPVEVNILNLGSQYYGKYSYNLWNDWLEFNSQKMNNLAELRTTAGHEFFHWVQMRYDNRMWASKVLSSGDRLWFEEATAVWAEEKFSSSSNYCSDARDGFEMQPFYGMQAGAFGDAQGHGYGMSAMVKYLTGNYGDSFVKNIFDKIKIGLKPADAIQIAVPHPASYWWADFLVKYSIGDIYPDISTARMVSDVNTSTWDVIYPSDTLKTFNFGSVDLSGKLFNIKLNCDLWTETTQMNFSLTAPDYCALYIFAYKGSTIEFLGGTENETFLPGLKAVKDAGYSLIAMVANTRMETPFTSTTNVELELSVGEPLFDLTLCKWARLKANVYMHTYRPYYGTSDWHNQGYNLGNVGENSVEGTWSENTFTAPLSGISEGYLQITVDPETGEVLSCHVTSTYRYGHAEFTCNNIPSGQAIYSSSTGEAIGFSNQVAGSAACGHITNIDYYIADPDPNNTFNINMIGYECNEESYITVEFFRQQPSMSLD